MFCCWWKMENKRIHKLNSDIKLAYSLIAAKVKIFNIYVTLNALTKKNFGKYLLQQNNIACCCTQCHAMPYIHNIYIPLFFGGKCEKKRKILKSPIYGLRRLSTICLLCVCSHSSISSGSHRESTSLRFSWMHAGITLVEHVLLL